MLEVCRCGAGERNRVRYGIEQDNHVVMTREGGFLAQSRHLRRPQDGRSRAAKSAFGTVH